MALNKTDGPINKSESLSKIPATAIAAADGDGGGGPGSGNRSAQSGIDNLFFYEDETFRIERNGRVKFGLVTGTADSNSADEYESDEYDDSLAKGEVRVSWYSSGKELVHFERSIGLADRTLLPGDVVRRLIPGKDTQRGYCREVKMRADVKVIGTKYVIKDVVAERLNLIVDFQRDNAVCLDSWVGSVKDVDERAIIRSILGSRLDIPTADFYIKSSTYCHSRGINEPRNFFPGNILVGRLTSMDNVKLLTPNLPLMVNKKGQTYMTKFTVESVWIASAWVHWHCKALSEELNHSSISIQQPSAYVFGDALKRLKRLNLFEYCTLQLNDRNFLKFSKDDQLIKKSQWDKEQAAKYKAILIEQRKEVNQNLFMNSGSFNSISHHTDKLKKKGSPIDSDRPSKAKRFLLRTEKHMNNTGMGTSKSKLPNSNGTSDNQVTGCTPDADGTTNNPEDAATAAASSHGNADAGWISDECECYCDEDDCDTEPHIDDDSNTSVGTNGSICSCPSIVVGPRGVHRHNSRKRGGRKFKKALITTPRADPVFKEGDELVTEAILVNSMVTVAWQDGSVEYDIPSIQLYPIHHLDNHEFFPGDYVVSTKDDNDSSFRDYGVIHVVDHHGRTARVRWFTTYTSLDEPTPTFNGETEESVYDLRDHPDFQYRPGTMVIRVANFAGADASCTAGQILDNTCEGRVKVWWVTGHVSYCWPQELFEVGQYDQTDWGNESEDSWETESENSELGCDTSDTKLSASESHVLSNIERVRASISRLEEIFNISPIVNTDVNNEVMRKLLTLYKGCRYLDRLLNTNFFHEDNFMGLIERVRKVNSQTIADRVQDRKNRLFTPTDMKLSQHEATTEIQCETNTTTTATSSNAPKNTEYAPRVLLTASSTPCKRSSGTTAIKTDAPHEATTETSSSLYNILKTPMDTAAESQTTDAINKLNAYNDEKIQLLNVAMQNIEKAFEKTSQMKTTLGGATAAQDDSGLYSRSENCDGNSSNYNEDLNSLSDSSSELIVKGSGPFDGPACKHLCTLLKMQLAECINEIRQKFYKEDRLNLSEIFDYGAVEEGTTVTIVERQDDLTKVDAEAAIETLALAKSLMEDAGAEPGAESPTQQDALSACEAPLALVVDTECFQVLPSAPKAHKYHLSLFHPDNPQTYYRAVQREHRLLKSSLPPGVRVRVYEDRMDLLSVMIEGPKNTPYEGGMFFFDIQLGHHYPKGPPQCHYISYCTDRLNPNLYEDGKVCVSLLGTWTGRDTEIWGPKSTLLQVIVSIQGLILVAEPYFNEAGYEKQKGSQHGRENSRMYNEMVIIKMVQATTKMLQQPPDIFRAEIFDYYKSNGEAMYERINAWMEMSKSMSTGACVDTADANTMQNVAHVDDVPQQDIVATCPKSATTKLAHTLPEFPLLPASRGFCLTLMGLLNVFKRKMDALFASKGASLAPTEAAN